MEQEISRKIRETRKALGITLKELSEKTQLSISFLSQVERGVCSTTLTSLKKIADALGIPIGKLLDIGEQTSFVNRKDNQIILDLERSYVRYVPLSSTFEGRKLEGILLTMEPHYCDQETMVHTGEEFYYILSGVATFIINGERSTGGRSNPFPLHIATQDREPPALRIEDALRLHTSDFLSAAAAAG